MRTRLPFRTLLALPLALAAGACSEYLTDPWEWGTVEVGVAFENGVPVPGVDLVFYSGTRILGRGVSDEDGRHTFGFGPPGELGVSASTARFQPEYQVATFRMREGAAERVDFVLETCLGAIRVRVVDEASAPVAGAQVLLYDRVEELELVELAESGEHLFTGLFCGEYGVRVNPPPGYSVGEGPGSSWFDGIVVTADGEAEVTFILAGA